MYIHTNARMCKSVHVYVKMHMVYTYTYMPTHMISGTEKTGKEILSEIIFLMPLRYSYAHKELLGSSVGSCTIKHSEVCS